MSAPGSTASLRTANQHRVVEAIRAGNELSQAEISRLTELAPATVSNIVRVLSTAGFLEQTAGAGRRGATVRIARSAGLVAGVDFGHSHVQVSLGDLAGQVIATKLRPLDNDHAHEDGLDLARTLLDGLLAKQPSTHGPIRAVGVGLPAPIGRGGVIDSGSILPGWVGVQAAEAATKAFGVPTIADNDANLGALAESRVGAGVGVSSMVYIKIASGVGAGIVLDGRVYRGGFGTAGEIGHMTMDENGPLCRCGSRGCLEAYVGGSSLVKQLESLQPDITMVGLVELARAEDVGARRLIEDAGRYLGRAVAIVANLIGPEIIVVGGDLATAGDLLLDGVGDGLRRYALEPVEREIRVTRAALGDQSSAVGTILLALDAVELPS
ncbi:ROK family transcriptional regulator [Aeromicrobium sp.]|uniref:ROK family transcriptional regulator n=1 Tax=Aeromicrobium sp. TaxID=1871063 RepID=UPI003D6ACB10